MLNLKIEGCLYQVLVGVGIIAVKIINVQQMDALKPCLPKKVDKKIGYHCIKELFVCYIIIIIGKTTI